MAEDKKKKIAKKPAKGKKASPATEKQAAKLTEWQKRNVEFLQKKKEREKEEAKELQAQRERLEKDLKKSGEPTGEEADQEQKEGDEEKAAEKSADTEKTKQAPKQSRSFKQVWQSFLNFWTKIRLPKWMTQLATLKAVSVLLVAILTALGSFYFLTPLSTQKSVQFTGTTSVSQADLLSASQISDSDYNLKTALDANQISANIKSAYHWVNTVQVGFAFPGTFTVTVQDYSIFGYQQSGDSYLPVYENGAKGTALAATSLPSSYLTINLDDESQIQTLVKEMGKISENLRNDIQTIELAGSTSTADLLKVTMRDGNTVLVPLSQFGQKMPYYEQISSGLSGPLTVDMEVGIYTTTESSSSSSEASTEASSEASTEEAAETATEAPASSEETVASEDTSLTSDAATSEVSQETTTEVSQ